MPNCRVCEADKEASEFPKNKSYRSGIATICKKCSAEWAAKNLKENYFKVYAMKFKTDEETVKEIISREVCDICGCSPKVYKRHSIDHCHKSGKVRGLLCDFCNTAIGKFNDDPILMRKAIEYLEKHND